MIGKNIYIIIDGFTPATANPYMKKRITDGIVRMDEKDTEIIAVWKQGDYLVSYDPNGATKGQMSDSVFVTDEKGNLKLCDYQKEYKVTYVYNDERANTVETRKSQFIGWSKTPNGRCEFNDGAEIYNLIPQGTITLYALWNDSNLEITNNPKRDGYIFKGWYTNKECTGDRVDDNGSYVPTKEITLYAKWIPDNFKYKVNYLEKNTNKVLYPARTDGIGTYGEIIKAEDEAVSIIGYKVESSNNIEISEIEENNVINIYYIIDENQRKDISYTVKYYKNGEEVEKDRQVVIESVQILHDNNVTVRKDEINITNKYVTYKLDRTDPEVIPEKIENGSIINVYYVTNEAKTGYIIEYYYENELDSNLTEEVEIDKGTIVTKNDVIPNANAHLKEGYKLLTIANVQLNAYDEMDKNTIKVYYAKDKNIGYQLEYYYNGVRDNKLTEAYTAEANSEITRDMIESNIQKNMPNAEDFIEFNVLTVPWIIDEEIEKNIIRVYYLVTPKDEEWTKYTIEYHYEDAEELKEIEEIEAIKGNVITDEKIKARIAEKELDGYEFSKVETLPLLVTENAERNKIDIYYTKRTDLSYTVKYVDNEGNELEDSRTEYNKTFKEEITEKSIPIDGYTVDEEEKTITIGTEKNEIIFIYTKRNDLSYTVKYLEQDNDEDNSNNRVLHEDKVVKNQLFESTVTEEAIEIDGFDKIDPTEKSIEITTGTNEIIFYYCKRNNLGYTVKYLEQDDDEDNSNNRVLHDDKVVENQVFESTVTEEAINIEGFNKVDPTEKSIKITTGRNEIIFYYTKRNDLSYTVKYLEQDDDEDNSNNRVLHDEKVIENQVFESTVTEEAINIDGFDKVNPIEKSIQIATSGNEIIFYYTKRTDLSYTVNYLEKDTNIVLKDSKKVTDQTFESVIQTIEEKIEISGYDFDSIDKETLTITTNLDSNVINIYYTKGKFNYTVEYYYDNRIDNSKTSTIEATFKDVITTYEDKNITGYKLQDEEGLPLTITEYPAMNVIKIYYVRDTFEYTVNYYYDGFLNPKNTDRFEATFGRIINKYRDKAGYGYEIDRVENLPLTISENPEKNVINVLYKRKNAQVIVKYVDKNNGEEISDREIKNGKVFESYDITDYKKEIEGYTFIENTEPLNGTFEEGTQVKTFYYAKNTRVIAKYLEKETGAFLADDIIINGYEGKFYTTTEQEIDDYTCIDINGNPSGKMPREESTVTYYYAQNAKVIVKHIDKISGEILETIEKEGVVGEKYASSAKDFEEYALVERPENETIIMEKDVITLEYYYKKISPGVTEKHIDITTNELLDCKIYEGKEGDPYKTESKEFEGYDLVEEKLPENAEGKMTLDVIEVRYYYIRKASVKVEYLDKATGEIIKEKNQLEEVDSTEYIIGHEGDKYKTKEKEFEGYDIVKELYPTNSEGIMQVVRDKFGNIVVDENGKAVTETVVKYYYAYKTEVIEKHIDRTTNEVLEEKTYDGHEGDDYTTSSKAFEGYDLVEEKLPENANGKMTVEPIIVNYYYIRNMTVKVEYIDINTNETLVEEVEVPGKPEIYIEQDSTEIIKGHEGDEFTTTEKTFENYTIVKDKYPLNWEGKMELVTNEDGTISTEIVVRYYYVHVSSGVVEKHIDAITGEELEDETKYTGNEGDSYKTKPKEFEGYDLIKSKLPENAEGKMTKEEIVVKYYYARKVEITVQYLEEGTNDKIVSDTIIESHEGEKYNIKKERIEGYEYVRVFGNTEGKLGKEDITIKYYYKKFETPKTGNDIVVLPNNSGNSDEQNGTNNTKIVTTTTKTIKTNNSGKSDSTIKDIPDTGDMLPFVTGWTIILVITLNVIVSIINKKQNNK